MISFLKSILKKLRVFNAKDELDLECVIVYLFILICAFRALFAGVTLTIHDIKWQIPDINLSATLPALYAMLSNSHRRYLDSKTLSKGDSNNGQQN